MFETVTVDEALRKGKRTINIPIYIILFGMIGISVYFVSVQNFPVGIMLRVLQGDLFLPGCIGALPLPNGGYGHLKT